MESGDQKELHLSRITTLWTVVRDAHLPPEGTSAAARAARRAQTQLIEHYAPAIHRYLQVLLSGDAHGADEAFQEFALRLLRGDLRRADPQRSRFRDYLKRTLINLARDRQRNRQRAREHHLDSNLDPAAAPADGAGTDEDAAFVTVWREALLSRAWEVLAAEQREEGKPPYYTVLRLRSESPDGGTSDDLATALTQALSASPAITAANARKLLQRARERFAVILLDEVAQSLGDDRTDKIEDELMNLELYEYCRSALARRRRASEK
jgi:RNA polymerase sigma-70 factor (ECF subfamily)